MSVNIDPNNIESSITTDDPINASRKNEEKQCRIFWQVFVSFVASLHSFGSFAAITGSIIAKLKEESSPIHMTQDEETWFASISLFGSVTATLVSGLQSNYFGRKPTLMISQIVAFVGFLFLRFANNVPMFYIGSFLGGYTNGINSAVMPTYVGEINQPKIRRFTGSFIVLTFTIGFAGTKLIAMFVSWRVTVSIIMALPCIGFLLFFVCPETPTWYMLKGRNEMGTVTLITLRGDPEVANKEASRIKSNLQKQKQSNSSDNQSSYVKSQLKTITKGTFVRPCMVVSIMMVVFWQWSGGALITFYTEDILGQFGVPIPVPWIATGVGCYIFICSFLGAFISSVIPRRKYYMGSGVLVSLGAAILGATVHLSKYDFFVDLLNKNEEVKWLPVIGLLLYLLGYQLGYISVCFMLLGELLPSNARGIGGCIIIFFNNISFFVAVKSSNICQEILGLDGLFGLFSIVAFFSTIFAYFFVPETFGKSLEEMEEHYREICYRNQYQKYKSKTENINKAYIAGQE